MAKSKTRRPPKASSPSVKYAADRAMARAEGKDPEAIPLPKELGPAPAGMSPDAMSPDVVARIRAEAVAEERARIKALKVRKPSVRFKAELGKRICERLAAGESLNGICQGVDMPTEATVREWASKGEGYGEEFAAFATSYARAREAGYRLMAEEIVAIADSASIDTGAVARDRLRVDARKWVLAKMLPKEFGDKLELSGDPAKPIKLIAVDYVNAPALPPE